MRPSLKSIGRPLVGASVVIAAIASFSSSITSCHHDVAPTRLSQQQMMDPQTCGQCHADKVREWSLSMHAYASDDPLFVAMNARAQRENPALGNFCAQCHAPLAVRMGLTTDGTNLASLDPTVRGVTCFFCHTASDVGAAHDNGITAAGDLTMRASITDPIESNAHDSLGTSLFDRTNPGSSALCGSCHDVALPNGLAVARTYQEWQSSLYSHGSGTQMLTCAACHMPGADGTAASIAGAPVRRVYDHTMPGLDRAIVNGAPATDANAVAMQALLDTSLVAKLCVAPKSGNTEAQFTLDDAFAGHAFPSGAAYHRRVWVELHMSVGGTDVLTSGVVPEGTPVSAIAATDSLLWLLGDQLKDASGAPSNSLGTAVTETSNLLPFAVTLDPSNPAYYHAVTKSYDAPALNVDTVTAIVHVRPVDYDTLDELIDAGDFPSASRSGVGTLDIAGTKLEWNADAGPGCVP